MKTWRNLHSHQFLDQQLASIRDAHSTNWLRWLAHRAFKLLLSEICLTDQTTEFTNVQLVAVRDIEKPFFQETSGTVWNHAVSFHFSETKTSITPSSFRRLSSQNLSWSSTPWMDFVLHHVLQPLVVSRTKEDHHFHLFTSEPVVHHFITSELVSKTV